MTSGERPNPDALLARVQAEESQSQRGKLKIFFGYAAGVGKTFGMLEAARREKAAGVDVVVGYVEPHGRRETEALLEGLEILPVREFPYRGVSLREFDLDAALARRPKLILVDELAHTNAEGSRHAKRWQDVEELLQSGINVWTTLNVQHIESLNDVIAQIAQVIVRETLPDAVLERADEIELIDLTPEELVLRLQAGKVYLPVQAERALGSFFKKGNLIALRELSLRQAAQRLHRDVEAERQARADFSPWATTERLLVCVGPSPSSVRVIRTAKRMAAAFGADWMAVAVDIGAHHDSASRNRTSQNLQRAEQLGAETHFLIGNNVAATVLSYARKQNVTKIIAGKTAQPWWKQLFRRTVVEELLAASGNIDVYVITGEGDEVRSHEPAPGTREPIEWSSHVVAGTVVATCTFLSWISQRVFGWPEANSVMIFLAGVALVATRLGRRSAILAALASVLIFDFFFVQPFNTFAVSDTRYVVTFIVMLGIGLLISGLAARQRTQLRTSQQQEQQTAKLFRMTRQLSELSGTDFLLQTAGRQLREFFGGESAIFLREPDGDLSLRLGDRTSIAATPVNATVARWVADHDQSAGIETDTLPNATALFVPLRGSQRTIGTLGIRPADLTLFRDPEQRRLLDTCASLIALSIERDQSVLEAQQVQVQMQAEQLRNSLFSSVSHDLRTPLTAIAGTADSLSGELKTEIDPHQQKMLQTLVDESHQLVRLVDNLLDMAKLESGALTLNLQWHVLEELLGSAIGRLRRELGSRTVQVAVPASFPLILVDGLLLEQTFANLLENESRYTPSDANIEISARATDSRVEIHFLDNGPGFPSGLEERVFDKFFRADSAPADGRRGVGLGLAICRGIVAAHGGRITASNRAEGGANFLISLPCKQQSAKSVVSQHRSSISV